MKFASTVIVVWGAGAARVDAIREQPSDLNNATLEAERWIKTCGRDDYWVVVLPIDAVLAELDADPAVAGWQTFNVNGE